MSARPVLYLLPGLQWDATVWRGQVEAFRAEYNVRIPSFYGFDSLEAIARSVLDLAPPRFAVAGLTIIEDAGHFAPIERPDAVNAALNLWLAG